MDRYATWLVAVGVASIGVGLALIVGPGTFLFGGYEATIAAAFFAGQPIPPDAAALNHWLLATCGAGVVGWGMAWVALAHIPLRRGEPWAWWVLLLSLCVWVALDLVIALWFGVTGEVMFVLAAFVAALIPLTLARPHLAASGQPLT